jgi:hypothetical protein
LRWRGRKREREQGRESRKDRVEKQANRKKRVK